MSPDLASTMRAGLEALGIERFVLGVHDASFPSAADEDVGRGSPYGRGARSLVALAASLGFDGIQLGPQGETTLVNASPYDGAHLTKSVMSIALGTLGEDEVWAPLARELLPTLVAARPQAPAYWVSYEHAWRAAQATLDALVARVRAAGLGPLAPRFAAFRARWADTLRADGRYEALSARYGTDDWRRWPDEAAAPGDGAALERHLLGQFVLEEQHQALRAVAGRGGVALFGDLQIGYSPRDIWRERALFLAGYLMGAPPSRTNPEGQPWAYPVLDPRHEPARALAGLRARLERLLLDFDGLRIDHPHGLVCPWVYAADEPDPLAAVGRGARLTCSPSLPDHPALSAFAIPRVDQLSGDPGLARYADAWVRSLGEEQVDRYGLAFDTLMGHLRAAGRRPEDVVCEVLSTWPYPLRRVMKRHGLGRFCVTQKADLTRPDDVYRSENASPRDWIMAGNHDTPPVWRLADAWHGTAAGQERALALATRLSARAAERPRLARWIAAAPGHLAQAMFAELFVGPARRVSMFFADWLGLREIYNRPGVVHPENWRLRIPTTFEDDYRRRVAEGGAFNLPLALGLALRARGGDAALVRRLVEASRALAPQLDAEIVAILAA